MKHCQYCNSISQIEETTIKVALPGEKKQGEETTINGPCKDIVIYTCDACFDSRIWADYDVYYSVNGEKIQA